MRLNPTDLIKRVSDLSKAPAAIVIGRLLNSAVSILTAPIMARTLGVDGRGYTAAILAVLGITPAILGMGVPLAVRRRAAAGEPIPNLLRTARLYAYCTLAPAAPIAVTLAVTIFRELPVIAKAAFIISMLLTPLTVSWTIDTSILVVNRAYLRIAALNTGQILAFAACVCVMYVMDVLSIASATAAYGVGNVTMFLLGRWWVRAPGGKVVHLKPLLREGGTLVGSQAAEIASQRLDQILVLPVIGSAAAGLYSVAVTIGSLPIALAQALNATSFPSITADHTNDRHATFFAIRSAWVLAGLAALTLSLTAPFIIPLLFGEDFRSAIPGAMVVVMGSIATVVGYIASMALAASRKGASMTKAQVVGLLVGIGLLYPAGTYFGLVGAAVASALGYAATMFAALLYLKISIAGTLPRLRDIRPAVHALLSAP